MSYQTNLPPPIEAPNLSESPNGIQTGRKYSVSEALTNSFSMSPSPFDFGGRSYVFSGGMSSSHRQTSNTINSPTVQSGVQVHEQTANLANIGVTDEDHGPDEEDSANYDLHSNTDGDSGYLGTSPPIPIEGSFAPTRIRSNTQASSSASVTPLISRSYRKYTDEPQPENFTEYGDIKDDPQPSRLHQIVLKPLNYLPAVFLGTLLNILDGLSYGMIMFPVSETLFSSLGPVGLSMFYVSCIVSQLVYSLGGSAFKSGIGSEMIEVTPFFHTMAYSIMNEMNGAPDNAIIATTIVSFAILSIVTGIVFFLLGKLRLGKLVGFFPRHILVGCIGGVGFFLVMTGIEVSSRLEGGMEFTVPTFKYLFSNHVIILQWTIPLALAIFLIVLQHRFHNSLLVPLFFICVFVIFHMIVKFIPNYNLKMARDSGWVFPAVEDNQPWYAFYELYKFQLVDWWAISKQLPSMLALTFFGILHVPINVPALAVTVGMDQCDVDRELVAHGYSNAISGLVGSIQNYLVYTNSVLFIRAGADDRLAGVLLAIATGAVMVAGPVVIGYIPVCVVGSLIYLLGYELLKEALYDTWGRLRRIEYTTIAIIVLVMGVWDFVYGVLVGILLACLLYVVEAAQRPVIRGIYTGVVARSTVLRHPKQQEFLKDVGDQICVVKLEGSVFFGSIGGVESEIRRRFEGERFKETPIKFLILDMKGVASIDFSAAEGFRRILNLTTEKGTQLVISSVEENDSIVVALRDAGLWENPTDMPIQLFNTLNYALEWCENSFLAMYKLVKKEQRIPINPVLEMLSYERHKSISPTNTGINKLLMGQAVGMTYGTPRTNQVYQAATRTVNDEQNIQNKYFGSQDSSFKKQPLPLLMLTFLGLSDMDEKFWSQLASYFVKETIPEDITFYDTAKDSPSFFLVESGLIRSVCKFESDDRELHSSILPLTAFGDLYHKGPQFRDMAYTTVSYTVTWRLTEKKLAELMKAPGGEALFNELLKIQIKLVRERFDTMTANLVISA